MGLRTTLKSLLGSDQHATRRAEERSRHDHCRQNAGLLEIALKPGRMRSFTPDDLPAFYKAQQERAVKEERRREERERRAVEEGSVGGDKLGPDERRGSQNRVSESVREVELRRGKGDAVLVVPDLSGTLAGNKEERVKEERREAVVVPVD